METSKEPLVEALIAESTLCTPAIINAFKKVDRKDFILPEYHDEAYGDYPLPIGHEQTISQPTTVAFMLELLDPKPGERVLDIGSGSGWTTALLADIVGPKGHVWGVELIPDLATFGQENLAKYPYKHAKIREATKRLGLPKEAPFDKILVSAANTEVSRELIEQLRVGGVMVIPIEDSIEKITRVSEKDTETESFEGYAFVPLIHK